MKKTKKIVKKDGKKDKKAKAKASAKTPRKSVKRPKPKAVATKRKPKIAKNPKAKTHLRGKGGVHTPLKPKNTGYKQLKDGSYRIYGWRVVEAPRAGFKELVIVEHTAKHIKKQFINMACAVKFIESQESEKLIDSGEKSVLKELKSVGLGPLVTIEEEPEEADVVSVAEQEAETEQEENE